MNTIILVVALAINHDWVLHHLDMKFSFLNGELKEEIYLEHSEGFFKLGQEQLVCKLKNTLYGLNKLLDLH